MLMQNIKFLLYVINFRKNCNLKADGFHNEKPSLPNLKKNTCKNIAACVQPLSKVIYTNYGNGATAMFTS